MASARSAGRDGLGQRVGVEQGEVGALAELRAGRVGRVADEQHRPNVAARQRDVAVGGPGRWPAAATLYDVFRPRATARVAVPAPGFMTSIGRFCPQHG